ETQLKRLRRNLSSRKLDLEITDLSMAFIAEKGYDPVYGARPLKRTIQRLIQDPFAVKILYGEFKEGDRVTIDADGEGSLFGHGDSTAADESWAAQRTLH